MRKGNLVWACWVLLLLGSNLAAGAERPAVGTVDRLQGDAKAVYGDDSRRLRVRVAVRQDDLLVVAAGSRLRIELLDGTVLNLGANAELLLDEFVYQPTQGVGAMTLRALRGAVEFIGGLIGRTPEAEVNVVLPVAILGVRGTRFWGGVIDDNYAVFVAEGVVSVRNRGGAVVLGPGEGTTLYDVQQAPTPPKQWGQAKIERALGQVRF